QRLAQHIWRALRSHLIRQEPPQVAGAASSHARPQPLPPLHQRSLHRPRLALAGDLGYLRRKVRSQGPRCSGPYGGIYPDGGSSPSSTRPGGAWPRTAERSSRANLSGSVSTSIATIRPPATTNAITENGRPSRSKA